MPAACAGPSRPAAHAEGSRALVRASIACLGALRLDGRPARDRDVGDGLHVVRPSSFRRPPEFFAEHPSYLRDGAAPQHVVVSAGNRNRPNASVDVWPPRVRRRAFVVVACGDKEQCVARVRGRLELATELHIVLNDLDDASAVRVVEHLRHVRVRGERGPQLLVFGIVEPLAGARRERVEEGEKTYLFTLLLCERGDGLCHQAAERPAEQLIRPVRLDRTYVCQVLARHLGYRTRKLRRLTEPPRLHAVYRMLRVDIRYEGAVG